MAGRRKVEPEEAYKPMAVQDISIEDKYEALEARLAAMEKEVQKHLAYHFGRV
jgi:hypothetical protein